MSTNVEPWQPILDKLAKLRTEWPVKEWTWDPKVKCVASTFAADAISKAQSLLAEAIPTEWTSENFAGAPEFPRTRSGPLRPGQKLLTGELVSGMMSYAMWWPWGDGSKVSVRIGIANDRPKELYPRFRALFGIAPPPA